MPSSPSMHQCLPLSHSSANKSFDCPDDFKMSFHEKTKEEVKKSWKHLRRSHSFFKKHQRPIVVRTHRSRRRYTFSGYQDNKMIFKKKRRVSSIAWPTKFLLGGNRSDPLNLRSLEDESVNQQLNAFSPASSPMPIPARRSQVKVVIPPNIYDPLNLNSGEEIELNLSKTRKRRRHRKSRREEHDNFVEAKDLSPTEDLPCIEIKLSSQNTSHSSGYSVENAADDNEVQSINQEELLDRTSASLVDDSIKSCKDQVPVTLVSAAEKVSGVEQVNKEIHPKSRYHNSDKRKFRANAEKFCYGNYIASHSNWNFDGADGDPRYAYLSIDFFRGKCVLDIGCNTGKLTMFVAKNMRPNKIIGIDIDKKLINIAQRQLREMHGNFSFEDMPESMVFLYGPLAKIPRLKIQSSSEFPNNVTFLEANYVPANEDYLETQKPQYDTILCLRVTKWIHLNFGDEGLKMAFKRMFAQLQIGGHLILEPQPWFTYSASKRITQSIYKTYCGLQMRPESFCDFLLSSEVGFTSCSIIGRSTNYAKGYRQNIYLFTKDYPSRHTDLMNEGLSPIAFHNDNWNSDFGERIDVMPDYLETSNKYSETNIQS